VARAVEQIGFFTGLGIVLAFVAALAIGRLTVRAAADVAGPAATTPAPAVKVPVSRKPVAAALLRRVASGKGMGAPSPAGSKEDTEPAKISS